MNKELIYAVNAALHMLASGKVLCVHVPYEVRYIIPSDLDDDNGEHLAEMRKSILNQFDVISELDPHELDCFGNVINKEYFDDPYQLFEFSNDKGDYMHIFIDRSFEFPDKWEQFCYERRNDADCYGECLTEAANGYPKNLHHVLVMKGWTALRKDIASLYAADIIPVRKRDGWSVWERAMVGQDGFDQTRLDEEDYYTHDVWHYAYAIDFGRDLE